MAWLGTWEKRIKLSIDADEIDADLANFPVLIYLSTASGISNDDVSCVFDELTADANRKKIAVTTSDGTTQCYVEIEQWDDANEQAWLWVKVPAIDDLVDTDLYLYYDAAQADNDTYVGDTNSAVAENVWDANFLMVLHLRDGADNQHVYDSTTSDFDGTKGGAAAPTVTTGKISQGQDFDGDEYITFGDVCEPANVTVEAWVYHAIAGDANDRIGGKEYGAAMPYTSYMLAVNNGDKYSFDTGHSVLAGGLTRLQSTSSSNSASWRYVAGTYDKINSRIYVNGSQENSVGENRDIIYSASIVNVGGDQPRLQEYITGQIDEFRVSSNARPAEWIHASYHSGDDSLIEFGTEQLKYTKVDGITYSSISKIDGISKVNITKIDGV